MHRRRSSVRFLSRLSTVAVLSSALLGVLSAAGCSDDPAPDGKSTDPVKPGKTKDGGTVKPTPGKGDASVGTDNKRDAQITVAPPPPDDKAPMLETLRIDDCGDSNPAGLSADEVASLKAGGDVGDMRFLYPYDGTVFPRGLGSPEFMWAGAGAKAVYVHVTSDAFDYEGCLTPDAEGSLKLPEAAWAGVEAQTLAEKSPFQIELSVLDGGTVRGPIKQSIVIARATLKGSVFYNTYNGVTTGAVERLKPGGKAEFFSRTGACTGCHSVSASGNRLVTKQVLGGPLTGYVFELDSDTPPDPAPLRNAVNTSFVGISPDGKVYLTTAFQGLYGPPTEGAITTAVPLASQLVETDTGTVIPNSGFPTSAMMPTFSFDGTQAVFNDHTRGDGKNLSVIDYDGASRTASNQRDVYTAPSGYVGWPFMLPDGNGVVFTQGESSAFSGGGSFIVPVLTRGPKSDLMTVDVKTGQATILARAMGYDTVQDAESGNSYLPFGPEEEHQAYYPTISPVAAGGYFWVFFDAIRHYGHHGLRRQIWVAAIKVRTHTVVEGGGGENMALYGNDNSFPAFYLPGQDFNTANHRAFAALDPCLEEGTACESGTDCCNGFCTENICAPPILCSKTNDKCKESADCCDPLNECLNNICTYVVR